MRPGEPGGVGREDEPCHLAVLAAVHLADLSGLPLDEQHPAVVRGDGDPVAVGRHGEPEDAAHLPGGDPARGGARSDAGGRGELQRVVALRVRHPHHPLLALHPEGARQPGPYAVLGGERAGGAGAVRDPVDGAAHGDRAAPGRVVGRGGAEPAGGVHRERLEVDALPAQPDVEPARLGPVQVVQQPQLTGGRVHDPGAVGGRVPGVEAVDRGVPPQVGPVGEGGVQSPDALVVRQERDPVADPQRVLDVPVQLGVQPHEFTGRPGALAALARAVDPQLARRAAPVPLPPGGLAAHRRGQQHGGGAVGDVADRPVRQGGGRAAVERDGARPAPPEAGLALGAEREDLAVGSPAAHLGAPTPPVRQAPGRSAVDGRDMYLGRAVPRGGPRDGGAVRGDPRMVHGHVVRTDPPGTAAVQRRDPHVVLGGEGDQVAVQMRIPEIRELSHPVTVSSVRTDWEGLDHVPRAGRHLPGPGLTCPRARRPGPSGTRWSG